MSQSEFEYLYQTGKRRGVQYNIGVRVDPTIDNVESFAVTLFFKLKDDRVVHVVRVDDSAHSGRPDIHADRFYRELGAEVKDFEVNVDTYYEAEDYIRENWERFADHYHDNHGKAPRDDGVNL